MLQRATFVELITDEHRLLANIHTRGQRLLDLLNDQTSNYLTAHDVRVYNRRDLQTCIAAFSRAVIRKTDLDLVIITENEHEAPEARLYAHVQKEMHRVLLTIPGYEIRGKLHLTDPDEAVIVLDRQRGDFFPVTEATVFCADTPDEVFEGSVVMVNKTGIALFCVGEMLSLD